MRYLGDYAPSTVIYGKFTTYQPSTGAAFTLGGTPALSVYKDNSTTQSTSGVTLTASFDSVTGLNHFAIDTSSDGTFYSAGSNFDVVITTGTVDGVSVVGSVVGSFSLNKVAALRPTTAGRALDVSAGGEAGIDWANVGSPTTAVNLSSTTIATTQKVDVDTIKTNPVVNAGTITFPTGATLASTTNITAGTITTVTNLTNAPTNGDFTATMKTSIGTAVAASAVASVTGNVGGNVVGSVGSVTGNVGGNVTGSIGSLSTPALAQFFTADSGETFADAVSGSVVKEIADNSGGGDPWNTSLPGAYSSGTAGYILGTNLDAAITSRLAPTSAGRTLDVTANGTAGIDWGNIENPSTAVNLSGTNIDTDQVVASVTGAVGSVTGAVGSVTGNVGGTVNGLTATAQGNVRTAVGLASADLDTQLGAIDSIVGTSGVVIAPDAIDAAALDTTAVDEIRDSIVGYVIPELTGDPGATPELAEAVMLAYMSIRNRRVTDSNSNTDTIADDSDTPILTAAISDSAGTFTKGKYA